jgi:hypothetical protein
MGSSNLQLNGRHRSASRWDAGHLSRPGSVLAPPRRTAAPVRAQFAPSPVMRWPLVFGRASSLVTAAARARLPHTVRIFAGARTAETPAWVRVPGFSGRCAPVFFRRGVRCAGDRNNRRQCNGSQHIDFRSHEKLLPEGSIMANGNVYAVGDPYPVSRGLRISLRSRGRPKKIGPARHAPSAPR